eukprot:scaffold10954_cov267-Chaetoceros_neogracile.AAC.3
MKRLDVALINKGRWANGIIPIKDNHFRATHSMARHHHSSRCIETGMAIFVGSLIGASEVLSKRRLSKRKEKGKQEEDKSKVQSNCCFIGHRRTMDYAQR